jgi:predicted RNase H-like nuclease (RuvC/YqgF family)
LILSKALRAQKKAEDESCQIALGNLRSEVIMLRNEELEKDKILFSLVDKLKSNEAKLNAQSKAHQAEVEDLQKKLAEMSKNFELAKAKQEISEWTSSRLEKNAEELRGSKEKCYEVSMDCAKKLKDSFAKVGAYSSCEEVESFEEILSDNGDFFAFASARGVAAVLEKTGCEHVKAAAEAEAVFSIDDMKEPSAEATLMGGKFYSNVWMKGGLEIADKAIKKNEKESHDA